MKQKLSQSSAAEQKLQERCEQLQAKLAEGVEERESLQRRVTSLDHECSDSKMEATQLRVEIRDAMAERSALQEHVITCGRDSSTYYCTISSLIPRPHLTGRARELGYVLSLSTVDINI